MYLPVGSAGGMDHCNDGARPRQPAGQKGGGTASLVVAAFMRPWPVAFRNAVKTGPVSEQGRPPERPERVSKRRENRRLAGQERSQEPIVMGSWLFSSNACNISSCEPCTHPGADSVSQWRFSIRAGWTVRRAETKVKRHGSQKPTSLASDSANVNGQFAIACANAPSQKSNGCVTEIPCRPSYGSVTSV